MRLEELMEEIKPRGMAKLVELTDGALARHMADLAERHPEVELHLMLGETGNTYDVTVYGVVGDGLVVQEVALPLGVVSEPYVLATLLIWKVAQLQASARRTMARVDHFLASRGLSLPGPAR